MNIGSNFKILSLLLLFTLGIASCSDDDPEEPTYTIPSTYDFENVSYSGQTQRLAMLSELTTYMKTANTTGTAVDADKLKAMFENDAANAGWAGTYEDSKQLKSKTFEGEQAMYESLMDDFAAASQSMTAGSDGVAGVLTSADGAKSYFCNANGGEYTQFIEKGLMGACLYYQATSIYFGSGKMDVDNETVEPGEGTEMEHHWDEAFGYFGVPTNFPTSTDGLVFWGKYCNGRDALLGTNEALMNELIKGRAAISANDLTTRDAAILEARKQWELVTAATAVHYINSGISNINDDALRNHALSEAVAFAYAMKFNDGKSVTNTNVDEILVAIGGDANFADMNFYNVTESGLNAAKDLIASYFSAIEPVKDDL